MISWIKGEIVTSWLNNQKYYLLINCSGLGYEVQILNAFYDNQINHESKLVTLWLKHIKKEDSDLFFGFISKIERDFFCELLSVKGIGPQIGMSLLNKFSIDQIINAINIDDKKLINSVQGIGDKMTERIFLELKNKILIKDFKDNDKNETIDEQNQLLNDIDIALNSLNYPKNDIKFVLSYLIKDIKNNKKTNNDKYQNISFEKLLKISMNHLDSKNTIIDQ